MIPWNIPNLFDSCLTCSYCWATVAVVVSKERISLAGHAETRRRLQAQGFFYGVHERSHRVGQSSPNDGQVG